MALPKALNYFGQDERRIEVRGVKIRGLFVSLFTVEEIVNRRRYS